MLRNRDNRKEQVLLECDIMGLQAKSAERNRIMAVKKKPSNAAAKPDKGRGVTAEETFNNVPKKPPQGEKPWQFQPGWAGGPGRPKGSRNQFSEDYIRDFHEVWKAEGKAGLLRMAKEDPGGFVRVGASLLPRESSVEVTKKQDVRELTTAELTAIIVAEGAGGAGTTATQERSGKPH